MRCNSLDEQTILLSLFENRALLPSPVVEEVYTALVLTKHAQKVRLRLNQLQGIWGGYRYVLGLYLNVAMVVCWL